MNKKILVGISSCLLGMKVRHDGGHKKFSYAMNDLTEHFEFKAFCPEVAAGLGTPRKAIHLYKEDNFIRVLGTNNHNFDVTQPLVETSNNAVKTLDGMAGYILKKESPSCGMERVRVYNVKGHPTRDGRGVFASALLKAHPQMPVEEEGRLMDAVLRENFIERVFTYHRWLTMLEAGLTPNSLMTFHAQHKFSVLSHNEVIYRKLGPLVASARAQNISKVAEQYLEQLMLAMKQPANRKRHTNVLMHLMGYFKEGIDAQEKQELRGIFDEYRTGQIPLVVPITMLKHYLQRFPHTYLQQQFYLQPYPSELSLRNNI